MSYSPECVEEFEARFPPMTETFFHPRAGYMVDRDGRLPHKDYSLQVDACANQNAALAAFAANWERRMELEEALAELLPYAEEVQDDGPDGAGWKSEALMSAIGKAYSLRESE